MSDKPKFMERIRDSKFAEFVREKVKPVAGDVLEIVGDITGRESIEKVGQFLNRNKENNEQLKALDAEFQLKKLEFETELEQIRINCIMEEMRMQVEDTKSARSTEIERLKITGKRDWIMTTVGVSIIVCFMFYVYCSVFYVVAPENREFFIEMRATTRDALMVLIGYYYGSSRSSRFKDETISKAIK